MKLSSAEIKNVIFFENSVRDLSLRIKSSSNLNI